MIVYDIVIGMVKRYVIRKVRYGCCVFKNLFGISKWILLFVKLYFVSCFYDE